MSRLAECKYLNKQRKTHLHNSSERGVFGVNGIFYKYFMYIININYSDDDA